MDLTRYRLFQKVSGTDPNVVLYWAIARSGSDKGIRIRHGKSDAGTKLLQIPETHFAHAREAQQEVTERILRKSAEGYREIGVAKADARGVLRLEQDKREPTQELHWMATNLSLGEMEAFLAQVLCALLNAGIECALEGPKLCIGHLKEPWWSFGLGAGFSENGSGGGVVYASDGPVPVVVLMALTRKFVGAFQFSDGAGTDVDLGFSRHNPLLAGIKWETMEEIGDELGLCVTIKFSPEQAETGICF